MSQMEATAGADEAVIAALKNADFDFRTVHGIAQETGLNEDEVREALGRKADEVRVSDVPTEEGEELLAHSSKPVSAREAAAAAQAFASKSLH